MSVQDIQFKEGETEAQRLKKLRQLVEEVLRLSKRTGSSSGGGGPDVSAADVITSDDETALFPNSRQLVAGNNITFDESVAGELEINATGGSGPDVSAAKVLTEGDESALFPHSRTLLPGTNVTFDDTTPGQRTVNASGGGGSGVVESVIGTAGEIDVDSTDPANPVVSLDPDVLASLANADSAVQPVDLAAVAFSGDYSDLSGAPAIPSDIHTKTFLTEADESAVLTASRRVLPGTGISFDDATPNVRTINATSGGSKSVAVEASWTFSTTTTASDPGSGLFRMNNATLASVTALYFNDTDLQSKDSSTLMGLLRMGHRIYVEQDDDKTRAAVFQVSGTPTDNTGWWAVPVTVVASATLPQNAKACWANFQFMANTAISAPEVRGASFSGGIGVIVVPTNNVPVEIREDCTITSVIVLTQGGTGSCVLDIWKSSYGAYPPTVANTITAAAKPTISSGVKYSDSTLTGWTKTLSAGDTLLVKLESCSTFTAVSLFLVLTPVGSTAFDGYTDERVRDVIGAALTDTATVDFTYDDALDTISAVVKTIGLDLFTSLLQGVVPASGGGTTNFLRADGAWAAPTGNTIETSGSFTATLTYGVSPTTTGTDTVFYTKTGTTVTLWIPNWSITPAVDTSTVLNVAGIPVALRPNKETQVNVVINANTSAVPGIMCLRTDGSGQLLWYDGIGAHTYSTAFAPGSAVGFASLSPTGGAAQGQCVTYNLN